jgi:hypothetical protein
MKATAITLLALLLPLQAQAQPVELTLNCQYEEAFDVVNNQYLGRWSDSFSAIVRMQTDGTATIDVSTGECKHFKGRFNELKVGVGCLNLDINSLLDIDRIDGAFSLTTGHPILSYEGHCKPSSKLF